jgi:hypothetical protein
LRPQSWLLWQLDEHFDCAHAKKLLASDADELG